MMMMMMMAAPWDVGATLSGIREAGSTRVMCRGDTMEYATAITASIRWACKLYCTVKSQRILQAENYFITTS